MCELTLICPTIGRSSLRRVVDIVRPQLAPGDQFIVVADGPTPTAREQVEVGNGIEYYETETRVGDCGGAPCDYGITRATGKFIWFIGDDDLPANDAFNSVRAGVALGAPDQLHIFCMFHSGNRFGHSLDPGYVSGQQIVVPNVPQRMPKMSACLPYQWVYNDFIFLSKALEAFGSPIFHDEYIATLERQNRGEMF